MILGPEPEEEVLRNPVDLQEVEARREFLADRADVRADRAPASSFTDVLGTSYPIPEWLITEEYVDEEQGTIKSGKEASVTLIERVSGDRRNLLAAKTYVQNSFRGDSIYGEGRKIRSGREKKAIEQNTGLGRRLARGRWSWTEWDALRTLWVEGVRVPYPVSFTGRLVMEFVGDETRAAPRVIDLRGLGHDEAAEICEQVFVQLRKMAAKTIVHGDLSAYNVLWWKQQVWIIDFPQAVDIALNPHAVELLQRDIANVCNFFRKFKVRRDADAELALALGEIYAQK